MFARLSGWLIVCLLAWLCVCLFVRLCVSGNLCVLTVNLSVCFFLVCRFRRLFVSVFGLPVWLLVWLLVRLFVWLVVCVGLVVC